VPDLLHTFCDYPARRRLYTPDISNEPRLLLLLPGTYERMY